jgi:FG-GAP-like repeat
MAGAGAVALALLATFLPPTDSAQAASTCTGWQSTLTPPPSIRVYRTALGHTVTVDFKRYVRTVMAGEWGPTHPRASLRAGAVAIKQYGWYFAMHWRGGRDPGGRCFDVVDGTRDQDYDPSRYVYAIHAAVVDETWNWTLRKGSTFFMTGYRAGNGICGSQQDGWHLMQRNASDCVRDLGESTQSLLRRYYGTNVSIVVPGANDMTGDGVGDTTAISTDPTTGEVHATLVTTDPAATARITALVADEADPTPIAVIADATVIGRGSVDLNGDRRRDIMQLLRNPDGTLRIQVMRSTGSGFAPAVTWWSSAIQGPALSATGLHLVTGDFNNDGRGDAGLVQALPGSAAGAQPAVAPLTRLLVLRSTGTGFRSAVTWWRQSLNLSMARFMGADTSGDGRADLVILRPVLRTVTEALVARSTNTGGLRTLRRWATLYIRLNLLNPVVGDVTRDGRDDIVLGLRRSLDQLSIVVLRATSAATFVQSTWWSSTSFSWTGNRLTTADVNRDGRADLILYRNGGADGGTLVYRLTSTGLAFHAVLWRRLSEVPWSTIEAL